ncbi:MAG TPA: 5-formyltetrahydrofolate cyclo-ligase [Sporichthyaceae bacterium]|nr:5-formyltetrahydrofolate cyclo-ligase [Sporichthyaceae bacterium]
MADTKGDLRAAASARRRALSPDQRRAVADALCEQALGLPWADTVALYVSFGSEPGTGPLLAALRERGTRVLLPVVLPDRSLDWAVDDGSAVPGVRGIPEPIGARLGPAGIATADLVLLPGLAADRAGNRLGRGGGSYDRALPLRRPQVPAIVLLHPWEVVAALPTDPHDVPVDAALTADGLVPLGAEWTNGPPVREN